MISNPRPGQLVQCWYNRDVAPHMPLHGLTGRVVIRSKRRPRNHGVEIDGRLYVVPAGNLRLPRQPCAPPAIQAMLKWPAPDSPGVP
jgi:hypothetical protein